MQVDPATLARYEHELPVLRDAVMESDGGCVMRRDGEGACVQFEHGWCKTHRDYGAEFLGDACHFYPRAPRALGEFVVVSGMLSCPEIARLALTEEAPFRFIEYGDTRRPYILTNYLPAELSEAQGLAMHEALVAVALDETVCAEHALMRVSTVSRSLDSIAKKEWPQALPVFIKLADGRLLPAEPNINDPFNLAHGLYGLVRAANLHRPRLDAIVTRLADALGVTFTGDTLTLSADAATRALTLLSRARDAKLQPVLRRYLAAQLSQSLFPFSGFGASLAERITIIGVRFATVKFALACLEEWSEQAVIDTVQPLSRLMDHLADPTLSLLMYEQTGWMREPRLRALIGA